jgi:hypothetical protein
VYICPSFSVTEGLTVNSIKLPLDDSAQVKLMLSSLTPVPFSTNVMLAAFKSAAAYEEGIMLNVCDVSIGLNRITIG